MNFYLVQFLAGLASAASLFLVSSGLSIIFGVTRIVNFAHGAFYMLGAYMAYSLTERLSGALGFWGGILLAALIVAALGALLEMLLLRRIYRAPELFQLLATFGVTLTVEDMSLLVWGPEDLLGRRAPGFRGAVDVLGLPFPAYDLFLVLAGPLVLLGLWIVFRHTRWGILIRAATQDREMVAALGVNQKWLFTGVFTLGIFLAALGGALQLPREAVTHQMDLRIITEVFVVVVIGGLGNVFGAFLAAILVSELNAFGILVFPKISLVLVFLVMALVLVIRPLGLLGRAEAAIRAPAGGGIRPWEAPGRTAWIAAVGVLLLAASLPLMAGDYALTIATEILIFVLYAASLHLIISSGGLVSFGHAAYFGLGSYGAAIAVKLLDAPMGAALVAGPVLGALGAIVFGWFCVRLSGVYFAMLTLAFAQIAWSIAFQWTGLTGGDNGLLGLWPTAAFAPTARYYLLTLTLVAASLAILWTIVFSPFGQALRAVRDSRLRSEAIGLERQPIQWAAFIVAGGFAALAGALYTFLKGSVFPDNLAIPLSVDGLVMVLLGGIETVTGGVAGAVVFKGLSIWLVSQTDYSKLALGLLIVMLVLGFPDGLVGAASRVSARRLSARRVSSRGLPSRRILRP